MSLRQWTLPTVRRWLVRLIDQLLPRVTPGRRRLPEVLPEDPDPSLTIPADIRGQLLRRPLRPFMESLRAFGRGRPGITRETEIYWVVRDRHGRIIGGAKADVIDEDLVALDVEIVREHRRRGHATRLYLAIQEAGIDVEAASDTSLSEGFMTPLGYAFQVGRRRKRPQMQNQNGSEK